MLGSLRDVSILGMFYGYLAGFLVAATVRPPRISWFLHSFVTSLLVCFDYHSICFF